jgi:hypothetical protein
VGVGSISEQQVGVTQFISAPGEVWEVDVAAVGLGATGISWNMSWRDYAGFIPVRVAPTFGAAATLIPVVLAGRVSVVGHPGLSANPSQGMMVLHNRDTVPHSYRAARFSPGVVAEIDGNSIGPVNPGDMVELNFAFPILGEGASGGIEQLEATVTTPSMCFACYQDLSLTP